MGCFSPPIICTDSALLGLNKLSQAQNIRKSPSLNSFRRQGLRPEATKPEEAGQVGQRHHTEEGPRKQHEKPAFGHARVCPRHAVRVAAKFLQSNHLDPMLFSELQHRVEEVLCNASSNERGDTRGCVHRQSEGSSPADVRTGPESIRDPAPHPESLTWVDAKAL